MAGRPASGQTPCRPTAALPGTWSGTFGAWSVTPVDTIQTISSSKLSSKRSFPFLLPAGAGTLPRFKRFKWTTF
ncbi:hypothetical protein EMCRGX_G027705 [Ephydatia muelleri]